MIVTRENDMWTPMVSRELFSENDLFSRGAIAGDFVFVAQDGRVSSGEPAESSIEGQVRRTLDNLARDLKVAGLDFENIASLMVYLPGYEGAGAAAQALADAFAKSGPNCPAITLVGIAGLEAGCRVRMDAIATSSRDRRSFRHKDLPLAQGSLCHGVRVSDFIFLAGVDATDGQGNAAEPLKIQFQTTKVLDRIARILELEGLSLGDLCRTFMFMPGTKYRPGYGEARKDVYKGVFAEDAFPPNSGIYIPDLGPNVLLRSVAVAYGGAKKIIASAKVRKAPGSFSQSVRIGNWLLIAGQDAVGFNREVEAEDDFEGQIEATLRHLKDIVEEAGGTLDDVVKTTVYLTAGQDRLRFAIAYRRFFDRYLRAPKTPAGLTMEVEELAPRCLVEIDAVAYLAR